MEDKFEIGAKVRFYDDLTKLGGILTLYTVRNLQGLSSEFFASELTAI